MIHRVKSAYLAVGLCIGTIIQRVLTSQTKKYIQSIVRIGQVSKVNAGEMTARVQIPDQGIVTGDLRIVKRPPTVECETGCKIKVKPWIPTVGQWVLCIFKPDGEGDGFIIGGI